MVLTTAQLLQVVAVSPELHVLLCSMHHAITDGWSAALLQQELSAAYTAVVQGAVPAWEPLPVQVRLRVFSVLEMEHDLLRSGIYNSGASRMTMPTELYITRPAYPLQVVDYAAWQRKHLEGQVLETELTWWKQTLAGAPPLLEVPWEKPRPDMATSAGIAVPLAIKPGVAAALQQLAAAEHTTLFAVMLSTIQVHNLHQQARRCASEHKRQHLRSCPHT